MSPARRPVETIDGIQYLRGIAALMVVCHHARHYFGDVPGWSGFGALGVDIFFVISGFIMAYTTRSVVGGSGNDTFARRAGNAADFIIRRFVRVVPLYWIALLWPAASAIWHGRADVTIAYDFAFIPHYHSERPDQIWPILIPGWTINYEMFFYCLFALSLLAGRRNLAVVMLALTALVLVGLSNSFTSAIARTYTATQLIEFVLGIATFLVIDRVRRPLSSAVLVVVLACSIALLVLRGGGLRSVLIVAVAATLIVFSTIQLVERTGWKSRTLGILGDASYSIYLFHLLIFSKLVRPLVDWAHVGTHSSAMAIAGVLCAHALVAAIVGVAVHFILEKPLLRWGNRRVAGARSRIGTWRLRAAG